MKRSIWSLKTIEKASYIVGIPLVLGYAAFTLYLKSNSME